MMLHLSKEAATFPISIYSLAVRVLLTFILQVAFVTYYPAQRLLHKNEFLGMPEYFQFGAPFVAAALLFFSYVLWCLGLRRITVKVPDR